MEKIIIILATGRIYSEGKKQTPLLLFPLAFLFCSLIRSVSLSTALLLTAALCIIAAIIAGMAEKIIDVADAEPIIIDTFIGICIAALSPPPLDIPAASLLFFIIVSVLFLLAERVQPFPANWIKSHLNGGFAIVLDDMVVGGYVCLSLSFCRYFGKFFLWS